MSILVVGSMNMDFVITTDRYPEEGETITGHDFNQIPGGKGANQATAAAKLGGEVDFISACGQDIFGEKLLQTLENNGVNVSKVFQLDINTGIANIIIDKDGNNKIIIIPGANGQLTPEMIKKVETKFEKANYVMLQLEIPLETVICSIEMAKKYGAKVILDPAPARELPETIYKNIDYLLPNEIELNSLLKNRNMNDQEKARHLLKLGVNRVIVTQGEKGVTVYSNKDEKSYKAEKVKAVDTTAAGDAFAGGLAYGLDKGWNEEAAVEFANKVAAFSVSKLGAQSSLPTLAEIKE